MPEPPSIPEIYTDSTRLAVTPYGVALAFAVLDPFFGSEGIIQPREQAIVRMSLEHAKALVMMLRQHLLAYEDANAIEIPLPAELVASFGGDVKEWRGGGAP